MVITGSRHHVGCSYTPNGLLLHVGILEIGVHVITTQVTALREEMRGCTVGGRLTAPTAVDDVVRCLVSIGCCCGHLHISERHCGNKHPLLVHETSRGHACNIIGEVDNVGSDTCSEVQLNPPNSYC